MKTDTNLINPQLELQRVVATISKQFIVLDNIDDAVELALREIGTISHSSRAYVFEISDSRQTMTNTYEWCNEGVPSEIDMLQDLPLNMFPWWIEKLEERSILNIREVHALGEEAQAEKEILMAQGILSVLVLPIHYNNTLHGFVGFDSCTDTKIWSEEDEVILALASEILSNGFKRFDLEYQMKKMNKELEEALLETQVMQSHLVQQEQMVAIGQLAAGVAHEINNPLGYVMSNQKTLRNYVGTLLDILQEADINQSEDVEFIKEDIVDLLDDVDLGLTRVEKIVKSLRFFSRVDSNVDFEPYDCALGLENTLTILNSRIKNNIKISVNIEEEFPPIIANGGKLNQVFLNLLTNAIDAIEEKNMPGVGHISIDAYDREEYVELVIEDNGMGIDQEHLTKIYQPFFTTKPVGKGTGFGMSIVYDIIYKVHKGRIEVTSQVGKGTTFKLFLPK